MKRAFEFLSKDELNHVRGGLMDLMVDGKPKPPPVEEPPTIETTDIWIPIVL